MAKGRGTVLALPDGIEDGVVRLRRWSDRDVPVLAEAAADEYVATIERLAPPFEDWLAAQAGVSLAIESEGEAAGGVGLAARHVPGMVEVGVWVVPRRRGEGLAGRALDLICRWALGPDTGIARIEASVEPSNLASRRALERVGFVREGLMRSYVAYGGERRDAFLYSLLAGDL